MSTKLNADELAEKRSNVLSAEIYMNLPKPVNEPTAETIHRRVGDWKDGYAEAIREVAQPIADERDELREALKAITSKAGIGIPYYACGDNEAACRMADELSDIEKTAEAILAKYPRP